MRAVHKKELPRCGGDREGGLVVLFNILEFRLAVGQKRYSGVFMDGTVANNDPFDLRSIFHQK